MFSLPIPAGDNVAFRDLRHHGIDIGAVVEGITNGRRNAADTAHFDPDLNFDAYRDRRSRHGWENWRGMLGQAGAAEGHLTRQGVGSGDIFLFFGLYRRVELNAGRWRFVRSAPSWHVLWGWLQVEAKYRVDELGLDDWQGDLAWATYHPHIEPFVHYVGAPSNNTVYMASRELDLGDGGRQRRRAGWGLFPKIDRRLVLTDPNGSGVSNWRLPRWFYPDAGKAPLTYHRQRAQWRRDRNHAYIRSAGRGQEFVLTLAGYPEATDWLSGLIADLGK